METDEIYIDHEYSQYLSENDSIYAGEVAPGVSPLWYGELAKQDIPPPTWVVDQLVPDESITIISALPAHYKTWVAFGIAIKVARGDKLFDQFETKQTNVLIVDEESGKSRLRKRLQMLGITTDTPIAITCNAGFKLTEESTNSLIAFCEAQNIGLIMFDSLTRLHTADENTANEMSVVMGNLKRLANAGLAVLLIHHNRKPGFPRSGGANEMRGSVDILAACDVQISLQRKDSNTITVKQNKNRDAEEVPEFSLELCNDGERWWFEYKGQAAAHISKDEIIDQKLTEYLQKNGRSALSDIQIALASVGGKTKIVQRLDMLVASNLVLPIVAAHGKKFFELSLEEDDE